MNSDAAQNHPENTPGSSNGATNTGGAARRDPPVRAGARSVVQTGDLFQNQPLLADVVMHYYPPRRRIWTALLLPALAMGCTIVVAFVSIVVFAPINGMPSALDNAGRASQWVTEFAATRTGVVLLLLPAQLVLLVAVMIGAFFSEESFSRRLGLTPGALPVWTWLLFMVSTPIVGIFTSMLLSMMVEKPTPVIALLETIFRQHNDWFFLVVLGLTSVVPGIVEELMFRGYLQKRLTERFPSQLGGLVAIGVSTTFFALVHLDSVHSLGVIPLGLWLGFVAWRCRSTWPAILCHMTNNVVAVMESRYAQNDDFTVTLDGLTITVMIISSAAFVASLTILFNDRLDRPRRMLAV